ncbi:flagellar export chaperone FliS [Oceanirhabdus seepicola]|uniref:Flagellar secretion chaperone FliS n=1 Tax=Oceanirhabdus seepicola TaxID=2828781 RepID=A0A9J6NVN0_9CLOT|nr:flagellar export chaperone FliS [Oceanirhabdus seepicola]MCM1988108.1 flagellar export chaperone FliS [Oceanirhabdus seepicola]
MAFGYNNAANAYKTNSVNYASKEQLLLMLIDGAVKFVKKAHNDILEKRVQEAHINLTKTQNIFYELMATLDMNAAGEWGKNLYNIYEFITRRLGEANMKKDAKILEEIIPLIEDIRNTWCEAEKISRGTR